MHTIQIFVPDNDSSFADSLRRNRFPPGTRIALPQRPDGMNLDPATLALIVDASKDVLVAAIGALGSYWAAKVASRPKDKGEQKKHPRAQESVATLEIDTLAESHIIEIDERLDSRLREVLPHDIRHILNIRLR
jgi:hypothetical protein